MGICMSSRTQLWPFISYQSAARAQHLSSKSERKLLPKRKQLERECERVRGENKMQVKFFTVPFGYTPEENNNNSKTVISYNVLGGSSREYVGYVLIYLS